MKKEQLNKLIESLEKLTGKKVKLKEKRSLVKTMGSLTEEEFKQLINNDLLLIPDTNIPGNLIDVITSSLQESIDLDTVAEILGEFESEDLDYTNYEDAARELTSSYKRFKKAIVQGYISAKEPLNFIDIKTSKVSKKKKEIRLMSSFDEFEEIDSLLRQAGFKASTIQDTKRGIVDETLDYYWWIARGDDMPHGITINNPEILKTKMYNTLLDYQGENEY